MVLQNTGKYRADRENSSKKDPSGPSSGPRSVKLSITQMQLSASTNTRCLKT